MRTVLLAALLASTATLALGCDLPVAGCGGYAGTNDRVLARGADSLILCENGGFAVNLASGNLEGRYASDSFDTSITHGTMAATQTVAFTLVESTDGTASATELGAGAWTDVALDQVAIDHANTQCVNLEARTWWLQ